jgi:restriction system protein
MKLKMAEKSLFAILLRSPWWTSIGIAVAIGLVARIVLPARLEGMAPFMGLPFIVIGLLAARRQLQAPSAARVARTLQAAGAMAAGDFVNAVEQAYRRDRHAVTRLPGPDADLEVFKAGRMTVVSCKRWKAARVGVEPLRELQAVQTTREAHGAVYIALGELTDNARAFAAREGIQVLQGADLAMLLDGLVGAGKRPAA